MTESRTLRRPAAAVAAMFFFSVTTGFVATAASAGEIEGERPEDILILGSSFVRGLKRPLQGFLESDGSRVKIKMRGPAGWALSKHAARRPTERAIASRDW